MLRNSSYYKSSDVLSENYRDKMHGLLNPYEFNLESNIKDKQNGDMISSKTKSHIDRGQLKK